MQSLEFHQVFSITSNDLAEDKAIMEAIFAKLAGEMANDPEYLTVSRVDQMNILANNVLLYHAVKNVLYNLDDLLEKASIADSVKSVFMQYYKSVIEGNVDAILSDDMPCKCAFTEFPIKEMNLRISAYNFHDYFAKVRAKTADEVFVLMDKVTKQNIKGITEVISAMYLYMSDRKFQVPYDEQQEKCTELCKEHKVPDIYAAFQVVINLFDVFPFNYKKFERMIKYKVNDPSIEDIEIQRQYLISTLRKDSKYDAKREIINSICNDYVATMERIQKNLKNEEETIRELYKCTEEEVDEFINERIKN